jgi:pilus assembly protein CpaB
VAVAILTASVASVGIYRAIQRMPVRQVEIATRYAIVAARPMPMGTKVTADAVKRVAWPARTELAGGFSEISAVVDRGLTASVVQNEPIVEEKLAPKEAGAGLPPAIPPGMRAMSVKVNEVIGVAGFVMPGSQVDVLVIIRQHDDSTARAVVSNVRVLTAGTRATQDHPDTPSTVVTLVVTPDDAERIALAQSEGQIMLALRNPLDTKPTETRGARTAALLAGSPEPVEARPPVKRSIAATIAPPPVLTPAPAPAPSMYTVEAIRAAKRTEEIVR